jgi:hypothetical protein
MFKLDDLIFLDKCVSATGVGGLFPVLDAVYQMCALHFGPKFIWVDFSDIVRLERLHEIFLHLLTPLDGVGTHVDLTSFLLQKLCLELQVREIEGDWCIAKRSIRILVVVVSSVTRDNQDREESKGEPSFVRRNLHVHKDNPKPDVGKDRGGGGDTEHAELLDNLVIARRSMLIYLFWITGDRIN